MQLHAKARMNTVGYRQFDINIYYLILIMMNHDIRHTLSDNIVNVKAESEYV